MARGTRKPVKRSSAFWDTSALVPLCVRQGITPRVIVLYHAYDIIVWWSTPVEMASALARLLRMKHLGPGEYSTACKLGRRLADSWSVIQPSSALCARAIKLVDHLDLRAADSLQLAAALEWCEGAAQSRTLLTADQRLREAALRVGFDVPTL
jgi:predicted nucleic acid-binding protein